MRRLALFLIAVLWTAAHGAEPESPQRSLRVLLLFATNILLPDAVSSAGVVESAIREAVPGDVDFFPEGLDALRLPGTEHEREFLALLLQRYASHRPDLIVAIGSMDGFLVRHRAQLWQGVPIMFAGMTPRQMQSPTYPADIPGTSVRLDMAGTIELALRLQPDARHLVVVAGSDAFDRRLLEYFKPVIESYRSRLSVDYMPPGSAEQMMRHLAQLPRQSIIVHLPIQRDGSGRVQVPVEIGSRLTAAANAPSYSFYDRAVGAGVVGGNLMNWAGQREMIGRIARELLLSEPRQASLTMHPPVPNRCTVDWRQLRRWSIPESRVPDGCAIVNREPTFWQKYRTASIIVALIVLTQSALIAALLWQRHRRREAELDAHRQRNELAHAGRLATVGELSAAIAHEINQPLAAILSNAEAGEALLESGRMNADTLREILASIRQDERRASGIIEQLRHLLHKEPVELRPIDLNSVIEGTLQLVTGVVRHNGLTLQTELAADLPRIQGDIVQLQQVLLNLVVNAMDAMEGLPKEQRRLTITTAQRPAGQVELAVGDRGHGIPPHQLQRVFEPFFSSKKDGMGLGLSISHSIVRAHGGRIWAESSPSGTTLRVSLPAYRIT